MTWSDLLAELDIKLASRIGQNHFFRGKDLRLIGAGIQREIARASECLERHTSFTTVSAQQEYDLPKDFLAPQDVKCEIIPLAQTEKRLCVPFRYTGRPVSFYIRDRNIGFFPWPVNSTDTIDLWYFAVPPKFWAQVWFYDSAMGHSSCKMTVDSNSATPGISLTRMRNSGGTASMSVSFASAPTASAMITVLNTLIVASAPTASVYAKLNKECDGTATLKDYLEDVGGVEILSDSATVASSDDSPAYQKTRFYFEPVLPDDAYELLLQGMYAVLMQPEKKDQQANIEQQRFQSMKGEFVAQWKRRNRSARQTGITDRYGLGGPMPTGNNKINMKVFVP